MRIRLRKNGPYVVEDEDVRLCDWDGNEIAITRRPLALCRCGASGNKPFCDGSHSKVGFVGGEARVASEKPQTPSSET